MGSKVLERTKYIGRVHNMVHCVRVILQQLWGTKSAVILQWIKSMIHGLYPHPVSAAPLSTARQIKGCHIQEHGSEVVYRTAYGPHCHGAF